MWQIFDGEKISETASRILPKPSIEKIQQTVSVKSTEHAEISQTLSAKLEYLAFVDEIPAIRPTVSDQSISPSSNFGNHNRTDLKITACPASRGG